MYLSVVGVLSLVGVNVVVCCVSFGVCSVHVALFILASFACTFSLFAPGFLVVFDVFLVVRGIVVLRGSVAIC